MHGYSNVSLFSSVGFAPELRVYRIDAYACLWQTFELSLYGFS